MLVHIDSFEMYPVYGIDTDSSDMWTKIDMPDELFIEFEKRFENFKDLQQDLRKWFVRQHAQDLEVEENEE